MKYYATEENGTITTVTMADDPKHAQTFLGRGRVEEITHRQYTHLLEIGLGQENFETLRKYVS